MIYKPDVETYMYNKTWTAQFLLTAFIDYFLVSFSQTGQMWELNEMCHFHN